MALIKPIRSSEKRELKSMVTFAFDDGNASDHDIVMPMFQQHGIRGTFFITHSLTGTGAKFLNESQIKAMADNGQEIGSHTMSHASLDTITNEEMVYELLESKKWLESVTGKQCLTLGIPNGSWSDSVLTMLGGYYEAARSSELHNNSYGHYNSYNYGSYFLDNPGYTVDIIKEKIDEAINNREWIIISMHRVLESEDDRTAQWQVTKQQLLELVTYVNSYRPHELEVVPFYEGARRIKI